MPAAPAPRRFDLELEVRDYELDQFGVVNNAVYLRYLEHARHQFLIGLGIDPAEVARSGRSLALSELHIRYRSPLRSRERFRIRVTLAALSGARVSFRQRVERLPAAQPGMAAEPALETVLEAVAVAVFLDQRGRPLRITPEQRTLFEPYLEPAEDLPAAD